MIAVDLGTINREGTRRLHTDSPRMRTDSESPGTHSPRAAWSDDVKRASKDNQLDEYFLSKSFGLMQSYPHLFSMT